MNRANALAFPRPISWDGDTAYDAQNGMTLREYAAIAAMQGLLADPSNAGWRRGDEPIEQAIAAAAVEHADALLTALAEPRT